MRALFFILFILSNQIKAQDIWSVTPHIEFDQYTTYSGRIDDKYPISMYLKESYRQCRPDGSRGTPRIVYGWYMYQNIGRKIPLVGHVCYADACVTSVKLFVPENIFNYSFDDNCDIPLAKEVFEALPGQTSMTWHNGDSDPLPVTLTSEHEFSWATKAQLKLAINGIEVTSLDLNKIANYQYIENVEILGQKAVNGYLHLILKYSYQSNPGSYGMGSCGAGVEEVIGYMKIDKFFEVQVFDNIQTLSCLSFIDEPEIEYDKMNPELGIREKLRSTDR